MQFLSNNKFLTAFVVLVFAATQALAATVGSFKVQVGSLQGNSTA